MANSVHLNCPNVDVLFAAFPVPGCPYPKTPVITSRGKIDGLIKRDYVNVSFYSKETAVGALENSIEELGDGLKMDRVDYRGGVW
ncbi:hypothetical protein GGS24DRAFT_500502 [Hypoxylon argillaceum]|nr:hypothetical protein GGS24DRAFT_500502 [Hypoxylon argillaceum]